MNVTGAPVHRLYVTSVFTEMSTDVRSEKFSPLILTPFSLTLLLNLRPHTYKVVVFWVAKWCGLVNGYTYERSRETFCFPRQDFLPIP